MLAANEFVHLHLHSEYSLLDGAVRIADIPRLAKENGHEAVALTDHGVMYGAVAFYRACVAEGNYYHLVLLVENEEGYRNLIALVSRAYSEGFYGKPRIDFELLQNYHTGLICLSGCMGGYVATLLARGDYDEAKRCAVQYAELFGPEHYYLEMQDHGIAGQKQINRGLRKISAECGIPLVITGDVHYPRRTDAEAQQILMCIQTGSVITDGPAIGFETEEYFYKSTQELASLFPDDE